VLPEGRGILRVEFGSDDPRLSEELAAKLLQRLKALSEQPTSQIYSKIEARAVLHLR